MGYMRHHAIIVTSWKLKADKATEALPLKVAYARAKEIFGRLVSPIVMSLVNGYGSFLVAPDGSEEGWEESDKGDEARAQFIAWLKDRVYDDGSPMLDWAEVQYGDDEGESKVTDHSGAPLSNKW